jgi:hypothetical protein
MFSDHSGIKLVLNNKSKFGNFVSNWKLNSTVLNNQLVKEEITRELRKHWDKWRKKHNIYTLMGYSESST